MSASVEQVIEVEGYAWMHLYDDSSFAVYEYERPVYGHERPWDMDAVEYTSLNDIVNTLDGRRVRILIEVLEEGR